jgi:hypothetical protein
MTGLSYERLKELLNYERETGVFRWREDRQNGLKGQQAGKVMRDGYIRITVDYRSYAAHRLAWLYMTGEWPADDVDHRDRCRSNNRWDNLRAATHTQNQHNASLRRDNTSGFKGVHFHKQSGKWFAQIRFRGVKHYLGIHATPEDAARAYNKAANDLHREFASTNLGIAS